MSVTDLSIGPSPDLDADYGPGHRYNDDLLLDEATRERAKREHPIVAHVIDWKELREAFRPVNDVANVAKKRSHIAGFWSVTAALLALVCAASEPLWASLAEPWPKAIVIASGMLGILAFTVAGIGLLYGTNKKSWLWHRLRTEQLRQMHFQAFVWQLPAIAASLNSATGAEKYKAARNDWLSRFQDQFSHKDTGRLRNLLDHTKESLVWQVPGVTDHGDPIVPKDVDLSAVFDAYEALRFNEQEGYAEHMLRDQNRSVMAGEVRRHRSRWPWGWYPGLDLPLVVKRKVLNIIWFTGIAVLVLMHVAILTLNLFEARVPEAPWPHVVVVVAALLAIAARTLSEGFALTREIERYEEYRAAVKDLHRSFLAATTPREKVHVMREMEKTAFEEMRTFLRSNHEATFIM